MVSSFFFKDWKLEESSSCRKKSWVMTEDKFTIAIIYQHWKQENEKRHEMGRQVGRLPIFSLSMIPRKQMDGSTMGRRFSLLKQLK